MDQPIDDHVRAQLARLRASGATLHRTRTKARTVAAVPWLLARHRQPYVLPAGGSSPVGALGYVEAAFEIAEQVRDGELPGAGARGGGGGIGRDRGRAGARPALAGLRTKVLGVVVNDTLKLDHATLTRAGRRSARLLRKRGADVPDPEPGDLTVTRDWLGAGYGHATPESERAIALAREKEGLQLDPVYTAKAMAGALAVEERGPLLYLHTHGPR